MAAELAALAAALREHADRCPCSETGVRGASTRSALVDPDRLTATIAHHDRAVASAGAHAEAVLELDRAQRDAAAVAAATDESFRAAGFPGPDEARSALLPTAEVARLRAAVAAHDEAALLARTTLAEPEIQKALDSPEVDVAALTAAREAAHAAHTAAVAADTLVRRTITGLDRVRGSITARCATITGRKHDQVIRELAETVAGTSASNELRMRLSAFVLAARLEKVADAGQRTALPTWARAVNQLRHTDGLAARGARSGLGLEVLDLWTGAGEGHDLFVRR